MATCTNTRGKVATYLTVNGTANQLLVTVLSIISLQTDKHTLVVSTETDKHKSVWIQTDKHTKIVVIQPMNIHQATNRHTYKDFEPRVIIVTCTIPAMCEENVSLNMTFPVSKERTSTLPLDQPVISSGTPSLFKSKL